MSFRIKKPPPSIWNCLPLFQKIKIYQSQLTSAYSPYVDKLQAKTIVKNICGDDIHVANVIRVLESPSDFQESDINTLHIIKASHGCGWNISMTEKTTVAQVRKQLELWNRVYRNGIEKQYLYITPRFFIEEKINDANIGITNAAITFMFRCIHGNPVTIGIRYGSTQNNYNIDWNIIGKQTHTYILERPEYITRMIDLAKRLSSPFEFVRMDFYIDKEENIYLSEYTFSPSGGALFFPIELEMKLGKLWR